MNAPKNRKRHGASRMTSGLALALAVAWSVALPAAGQCQYEATIIQGPMCPDGFPAGFVPTSLDELGNAAGYGTCFLAWHATVWDGSGLGQFLPDIGESRAYDMAAPELIVGITIPTGSTLRIATCWENGLGQLLPLLAGTNTSQALGVNSIEQIVGESYNDLTGPIQAFIWESGVTSALVLPLGPDSRANDINDAGQVTGWMGRSPFNSNAFLWQDGQVIDLGKIPGGTSAEGLAISRLGHVVGRGLVPDGVTTNGKSHAMYWDGQTMYDLGTLPGHNESLANDLNDAKQIVGSSFLSGGDDSAVLWQDGQIYKLDDLVVTDLGGLTLRLGTSINESGQILAFTAGGGILLTPIGSAPGDIDNNCLVNVEDLIILLGDWGQTNSVADTNEDGVVNVPDLLQVLRDWG